MPLTVTLVGSRHTDGTAGRVSLFPRTPWYVSSGSTTMAPGPLYFAITSSGTLETLAGDAATVVPTYDSNANLAFVPSGSAYSVRISIAGQEMMETWTIDGAIPTNDWAVLGVKASPSDRITYPIPLTVDSPVRHYDSVASFPSGSYPGALVYLTSGAGSWWGYNSVAGWHQISDI